MNHWSFVAVVVLHIFVCVLLVLLILVQNDKGGGLAGAFGGMGGGAAFSGSSAATFLTRLTQWVALASFVILLTLNWMSTKGIQTGQRESELKSARRGLSSVIPADPSLSNGASQGAGPAIPGLGTAPGNEQGVPAAVPSAETGAPGATPAPGAAPATQGK